MLIMREDSSNATILAQHYGGTIDQRPVLVVALVVELKSTVPGRTISWNHNGMWRCAETSNHLDGHAAQRWTSTTCQKLGKNPIAAEERRGRGGEFVAKTHRFGVVAVT